MKKLITFLLVLMLLWSLAGCNKVEEAAPTGLRPMVQIDGVMYYDTGFANPTAQRREGYDGYITSKVQGNGFPTKDNESNFNTGYGYQFGEQEGTVEIYFNGYWWIFATEDVKNEILYPEQNMAIDCPPGVVITLDEDCIEPRTDKIDWEYRKDGQLDQKVIDRSHALEAKHTSPALIQKEESSLEVWLHWEVTSELPLMPDIVTVRYWAVDSWDDLQAEPIETFRLMESNEAGDSYLLHLQDGNYIYEVTATWQSAPNFNGTVCYSFHT